MSTTTAQSELQEKLESLRKKWLGWTLFRISLQTLFILVAGLLLLWVADTYFFLSPAIRSGCFFALTAAGFLNLINQIRQVFQNKPLDPQLAALIELEYPQLREKLITAVGYSNFPESTTTSRTTQNIQNASIHSATKQLLELDLKKILKPTRTIKTILFLGVLMMLGGLFFFFTADRSAPWNRILIPWNPTSLPFTIEVGDGNKTIPTGSTLELQARLLNQQDRSSHLQLFVHWESTVPETDLQSGSFPLVYDSTLKSFPIRWEAIETSRQYWISSNNSFDRSPQYQLQAVTMPKIESALLKVIPPKYTNQPSTQHDGAVGHIPVQVGSEVVFHFTSNKPILQGEVLFTPQDSNKPATTIPLLVKSNSASAFAKLPSSNSGSFSLTFQDTNQQFFSETTTRVLDIQPDASPIISPQQISEIDSPTNEKTLFNLPVEVTDDISPATAEMILIPSDAEARILKPAQQKSNNPQTVNFQFTFPLSEFELEEAEDISVRFRATDNRTAPRPNETWTDPVPLSELLDPHILNDEAALEKARDESLQEQLANIREDLEQQQKSVEKLTIQARLDQPLNKTQTDPTKELLKEQLQIALQLETIAQEFTEQALYQELAPLAQHVARHEIPTAGRHLTEASKRANSSPKAALPALTSAEQQLTTATNQVAQLEDWLDKLIALKDEVPELNNLAQSSQALADQLKNEAGIDENTISETSDELNQSMEDFFTRNPEVAQAAQAALQQQLRDLASQLQLAADQQAALNDSIVSDMSVQQAELNRLNPAASEKELSPQEQEKLSANLKKLQQEQQQLQQQAATLAIQSAQKNGFKNEQTQQALQLVQELEATANYTLSGQLQEAADSTQQANHSAQILAKTNNALTEQANQLLQEQQKITEEIKQLASSPAARHTARQLGQQQLRQRVSALNNKLEQINEQSQQLSATTESQPALSNEKMNSPSQFMKQADKAMLRSLRRLKSKDYLLARESTRSSNQLLQQAAKAVARLTQSADQSAPPLPESFSQQISEAANQLQAAQQSLAATQNETQDENSGEKPSENNQPSQTDNSATAKNFQQAAQALNQASQQLNNQEASGAQSESQTDVPPQTEGATEADAKKGGTGTQQTLTAAQLQQQLHLISQRKWGAVSTELKSEIRQSSRYRHKSEYASQIKSYFKELANPIRSQSSSSSKNNSR